MVAVGAGGSVVVVDDVEAVVVAGSNDVVVVGASPTVGATVSAAGYEELDLSPEDLEDGHTREVHLQPRTP